MIKPLISLLSLPKCHINIWTTNNMLGCLLAFWKPSIFQEFPWLMQDIFFLPANHNLYIKNQHGRYTYCQQNCLRYKQTQRLMTTAQKIWVVRDEKFMNCPPHTADYSSLLTEIFPYYICCLKFLMYQNQLTLTIKFLFGVWFLVLFESL